jgi:Abi-like protein
MARITFADYQKALSVPRLDRYRFACHGDEASALLLYRYNIRLCQDFYALLGIFEITLRNAIDRHYQLQFGEKNWLEALSAPGGIFTKPTFKNGQYKSARLIQSSIKSLKPEYTHDRLVSTLSLGFWVALFNKLQFSACGKTLHQLFTHRPQGSLPREMYKDLNQIRLFRNRIAHYEPICFDQQYKISVAFARDHYKLVRQYLFWLGYDPDCLLFGIDHIIRTTEKIAQRFCDTGIPGIHPLSEQQIPHISAKFAVLSKNDE